MKLHDKYILIVIIILTVTFILIKNFSSKSEKVLLNYANKETIKISTVLINETLNKINSKYNYDNIIKIEKDTLGNITSIDFNETLSNSILYEFTNILLSNIDTLEEDKIRNFNLEYFNYDDLIYYVPIGIIYNISSLGDFGPDIPFKTSLLSSADTSINSSIKEYGINNSLIELNLNINLYVQVILPFTSDTLNINKTITLDRKIIQGKIPTYYNTEITSLNK